MRHAPVARAGSTEGRQFMASSHVLIVEDDPTIQQLLVALLEDEGLPAIAVTTGTHGLDALRSRSVACMLLDLNLPDLDGAALLQRARQAGLHVPTLLITADPRGKGIADRAGIPFLSKPFDLDHLITTIHSMIGMSPTA
jgi:DNA-binding response OmpR family regulator